GFHVTGVQTCALPIWQSEMVVQIEGRCIESVAEAMRGRAPLIGRDRRVLRTKAMPATGAEALLQSIGLNLRRNRFGKIGDRDRLIAVGHQMTGALRTDTISPLEVLVC